MARHTLREHSRALPRRISGALEARIVAPISSVLLERRVRQNSTPVVGDVPVDVSLTSHGERIGSVHLAIESIARGRALPRSITLWLDIPEASWRPTPQLVAQMRRGLAVRFTENFGPHTKYYPHCVSSGAPGRPLVTADDDIIYPVGWLDTLWKAFRQSGSQAIVAHRAHWMEQDGNGSLRPYLEWTRCGQSTASPRVFATGVSGVIYPAHMLAELRERGTAFRQVAPRADDVWLHLVALRAGIPVRQAAPRPLDLPVLPGTQGGGLGHGNVFGEGNDVQIGAAYGHDDLRRLFLDRSSSKGLG